MALTSNELIFTLWSGEGQPREAKVYLDDLAGAVVFEVIYKTLAGILREGTLPARKNGDALAFTMGLHPRMPVGIELRRN